MNHKRLILPLLYLGLLGSLQALSANPATPKAGQPEQIAQQSPQVSSAETQIGVEQQTVSAANERHNASELVGQLLGPIAALIAAAIAFLSFRWGVKNWRWSYFTKEWSTLMQFLKNEPKFMDRSKTEEYKTSFIDEDSIKYDLIARLCIGYLEDLYFLRSEKEMRTYFKGSIRLLGGHHRRWLLDNAESYHKPFYDFLIREIDHTKHDLSRPDETVEAQVDPTGRSN